MAHRQGTSYYGASFYYGYPGHYYGSPSSYSSPQDAHLRYNYLPVYIVSRPQAHPQATAQDRVNPGIPAAYSTKNWDPTQEPIFLLGSVFDADSLGKWIFDWTHYRHGRRSNELTVAGNLWLSLIRLSGKIRQAKDLLLRRGKALERRLIGVFLDHGHQLLGWFMRLLKSCEKFMMKEAIGDSVLGPPSGCAFVDCMFGMNMNETEELIASIGSWDKKFDTARGSQGRGRSD
ncbi:MAG: hypothetical protein M1816_001183 [Peltula sp. TS41687]|nr:MAG: hypothetical protein M1816_001183 [Peltula sp. TS41687]